MVVFKEHDVDWLSSVLPSNRMCSSQGTQLELHRRLVHLATLREEALSQLQQLDSVKVSLTERKIIQQGRLIAALDARLAAAHAVVDPHRTAVHNHVRALEKAAAYYSNVLQGTSDQPSDAEWADVTEQYKQLQQQQEQHQQQAVCAHLSGSLASSLQPCSVSQVEAVEQLRAEKDQLLLEVQEARSSHQQVSQQVHSERAARLLAEQQQRSMQQELCSLRQLANYIAQQLHAPQQQSPGLMYSQQQMCAAVAAAADPIDTAASSSAQSFLLECQQLQQQLQQIHATVAGDRAVSLPLGSSTSKQDSQQHQQQQQQRFNHAPPQQEEQDVADPAAVLAGDPVQELRHLLLGSSRPAAQVSAGAWSARPTDPWCPGGSHDSRLRQAYQQMLKQVQARYQQELRQTELQHQQALQSQAVSHTEALTKLTQQHQEACTRLAAVSADEAEAQQCSSTLQQQNQQLQQQVHQLQQELSAAAASALAVAQVQHEQQLLAVKQEHQQLVHQAKEELDSLRQQLRDQAAAVPDIAAVATMVKDAAVAHLKGQEEAYQSLVQQREQQHMSLLQELAQLRQLQAESSVNSVSSDEPAQQQHTRLGTANNPQGCLAPQVGKQTASLEHSVGNRAVGAPSGPPTSTGSDHTLTGWRQPTVESNGGAAATDTFSPDDSSGHLIQQQQQQQAPSAMSSLITAVLGTGPKAKALQAAHAQRAQQQDVQSTAALLHAMDYKGQLAELDQVLGLNQPASAAAASTAVCGSRQARSPDRANAAAPVALAGSASQRAAVAEHIQHQATAGQQMQQSAVRSRSNSRSPPAAGRLALQQQQHALSSTLKQSSAGNSASRSCLRCGVNDASSPGRCCFHPGFVPVPGPLMYSPEWHACRASCTPGMPGCYSRREHYYLPHLGAAAGFPKAGQLSGRKASRGLVGAAGGEPPATAATVAASSRSAMSPAMVAVHGNSGKPGQASTRHGSSAAPVPVKVDDRWPGRSFSAGKQRQAMGQVVRDQGELTPRSILPKPITPGRR